MDEEKWEELGGVDRICQLEEVKQNSGDKYNLKSERELYRLGWKATLLNI